MTRFSFLFSLCRRSLSYSFFSHVVVAVLFLLLHVAVVLFASDGVFCCCCCCFYFCCYRTLVLFASDGVFAFDSVSIGDNCGISRSILSSGVSLGASSSLSPGCVLGPNVRVGNGGGGGGGENGVTLPEGTQLTTADEFGAKGVQKGTKSQVHRGVREQR